MVKKLVKLIVAAMVCLVAVCVVCVVLVEPTDYEAKSAGWDKVELKQNLLVFNTVFDYVRYLEASDLPYLEDQIKAASRLNTSSFPIGSVIRVGGPLSEGEYAGTTASRAKYRDKLHDLVRVVGQERGVDKWEEAFVARETLEQASKE